MAAPTIECIRVYRKDLPVKGGAYRMSHTQVQTLDTTIVEVVTQCGRHGFGEVCPLGAVYQPQFAGGARAALEQLAPALIGASPLAHGRAMEVMDRTLRGMSYAKAAIDVALWDLIGKFFDSSVSQLLGGPYDNTVPSYAVADIADPDTVAQMVAGHQQAGYQRIQVKVGTLDVETDIARIRRARAALAPHRELIADANGGWTTGQAMQFSAGLEGVRVMIEQPCRSYAECRAVRPRLRHPVILDECIDDIEMLIRAIGEDAADGFGLKLTRLGGISAMRAARDICQAARKPMSCDDSWGGELSAAACIQVAATVRPALCAGAWVATPHVHQRYAPDGPVLAGPRLPVSTAPGLGVTPAPGVFGEPIAVYA